MPTPPRIRVMISSRNNQEFPYKKKSDALLSDIRTVLAEQLEAEKLFGEPLFEVWINEVAPAAEGDENIWEKCRNEVRRADVVVVLYNGDAGWAKEGGEIGICHAEFEEGMGTAPAKVRVIRMEPLAKLRKGEDRVRDELFRREVDRHKQFTGRQCRNGEELIDLCKQTLREATAEMARLGVREARKGKYYSGGALDWSRLDFRARQREMRSVLHTALEDRGGTLVGSDRECIAFPLAGDKVLMVCHAIPASFSIPEAREGVSQAFLRDHELVSVLGKRNLGPVHLIACHKSITESQALRQLGFPDATLVAPPFGIFVADDIQKAQLFFLANCRDQTAVINQVQRLFDWIEQVDGAPRLVERAAARARIVQAIAAEQVVKSRRAGA